MSLSNKVLGAAIFGAGWVAGEHAKAYQACPRTRLVAVGSRKEESARRCAVAAGAPDAFITADFDSLLKRPELLVSTMTEKLLTYALGRSVEADDMPAVRTIVRGAAADNYRFSSLVRGIVNSVPFQMRRAETDPGTH